MDTQVTEELFADFVTLSQKAFANGLYESAYHALQSAFHCASTLEDEPRLLQTAQLARDQITQLDASHAQSKMSSQAARDRGGLNFYESLIRQITNHIQFIKEKQQHKKRFSPSQQ